MELTYMEEKFQILALTAIKKLKNIQQIEYKLLLYFLLNIITIGTLKK